MYYSFMNAQIDFLLSKSLEFLRNSNLDSAEIYLKHALKLQSNNPHVLRLLGVISAQRNQYSDALNYLNTSIKIFPKNSLALSNLGNVLQEIKDYSKALDAYNQAIKIDPKYEEVWSNKGNLLSELKRYDEAIVHYDNALSLRPDYAEAWSNKGNLLSELKRYDDAIAHYDKALSLRPDYAEAWSSKGDALNCLRMHSESAQCYLKALNFSFEDRYFPGKVHHQMMLDSNWFNYEKNVHDISVLIYEGRMASDPFGLQGIVDNEEILKKCAEIYSHDKFPSMDNLSKSLQYKHNKIRIGYLCGEFRSQATSTLMTGVWSLHDKSKFEIFAFDAGWHDESDYRQRIDKAFDNIFGISKISDLEVVKLIQENEIDILVNLNGFFGEVRQQVFSYKPAPIQVNYLGFPGTIGIDYMDYIVGDKVVIPEDSKKYYSEKVVYLANSYQANDNQKKISDKQFTRLELGLPESGFVFCCFNNNYKINPAVFDVWMRILSLVEGSVLWLLIDNAVAKENLIKEAAARGIASSRLVFADRMPLPEHLARHRQADLFLDTLPYNAHTTASDALWAGLPLLTLVGSSFAGRVAASLLTAIGLPELITTTKEDYQGLAVELATNPQKLDAIKQKLAENRLTTPLFDTPRFTKDLEAAYIKMYERFQNDLQPDHIYNTKLPADG
jgi:protein O-GlcNAc transferase